DQSHGEILNLSDNEFRQFAKLLARVYGVIAVHNSGNITEEILEGVNLLILGCPANSYFLKEEIRLIVDFVVKGGNLFVLSEYGADSVQKTNLNDLTKHFGIYFEKTVVHTSNGNTGATSLQMITDIINHEITKDVHKVMLGGCCSIRTAKNAFSICNSSNDSWIEIYDDLNNTWIKNNDFKVSLISAVVYGLGRVVALGDIDIFGQNNRFGLNSLDNKRLIHNIFLYFQGQVQSNTTMKWILGQLSLHREEFVRVRESFGDIIENQKILEKRISRLEETQIIPIRTIIKEYSEIVQNAQDKSSEKYSYKGQAYKKFIETKHTDELRKNSD
ncbi:MAG: hypothetical protein ACTSWY_04975, partial [Promethearchaeota archaeon]